MNAIPEPETHVHCVSLDTLKLNLDDTTFCLFYSMSYTGVRAHVYG